MHAAQGPILSVPRIAWVAIPVAIHVVVLATFWVNAPVLDDYDFMRYVDVLARARGLEEWVQALFAVGNEHRAAVPRLLGAAWAWTAGGFDFRWLTALGTIFLLGTFALLRHEFRHETSWPIVGAAAFLVFQWSYSEALIQATGALPHVGVVLIAFAALAFALRAGWTSALACAVGGVLAAYTQANGLFVLPIAGLACLVGGRYRRGAGLLALAAVVWLQYFTGYQKPAHHLSPFLALEHPVRTFQFFLVNIGAIFPSVVIAQAVGAIVLGGLAWCMAKGLWQRHPTVVLWIAFILATAAIMAVGRVGYGLFIASRYALNAAVLMGILVFAIFSLTRPWRPRAEPLAWIVAGVLSICITFAALPELRQRRFQAQLLVEVPPSGQALGLARFAGVVHPGQDYAVRILEMAGARGWYVPPSPAIHLPALVPVEARPLVFRRSGAIDTVAVEGAALLVEGWTDVAAPVPGRRLLLHSQPPIAGARLERLEARRGVAEALRRPETLLSGFRVRLAYASEADARAAAPGLCVFAEAPGYPMAELIRSGVRCQ